MSHVAPVPGRKGKKNILPHIKPVSQFPRIWPTCFRYNSITARGHCTESELIFRHQCNCMIKNYLVMKFEQWRGQYWGMEGFTHPRLQEQDVHILPQRLRSLFDCAAQHVLSDEYNKGPLYLPPSLGQGVYSIIASVLSENLNTLKARVRKIKLIKHSKH